MSDGRLEDRRIDRPERDIIRAERQRPVKLGPSQGSNWIVLDGLKAGEQVMVDGFQKLPRAKPGEPIMVKPVPWAPAGTPPQTSPGTAPAAKP